MPSATSISRGEAARTELMVRLKGKLSKKKRRKLQKNLEKLNKVKVKKEIKEVAVTSIAGPRPATVIPRDITQGSHFEGNEYWKFAVNLYAQEFINTAGRLTKKEFCLKHTICAYEFSIAIKRLRPELTGRATSVALRTNALMATKSINEVIKTGVDEPGRRYFEYEGNEVYCEDGILYVKGMKRKSMPKQARKSGRKKRPSRKKEHWLKLITQYDLAFNSSKGVLTKTKFCEDNGVRLSQFCSSIRLYRPDLGGQRTPRIFKIKSVERKGFIMSEAFNIDQTVKIKRGRMNNLTESILVAAKAVTLLSEVTEESILGIVLKLSDENVHQELFVGSQQENTTHLLEWFSRELNEATLKEV